MVDGSYNCNCSEGYSDTNCTTSKYLFPSHPSFLSQQQTDWHPNFPHFTFFNFTTMKYDFHVSNIESAQEFVRLFSHSLKILMSNLDIFQVCVTNMLPVKIMAHVPWLTAPTTVIVQRDILILTAQQVSIFLPLSLSCCTDSFFQH